MSETKVTKETTTKRTVENGPSVESDKISFKQDVKVVALNSFGGLRSVRVEHRGEPSLEKGQVLIRVKAAGVNFLDLMARQGVLDMAPKLPAVMGFELAGDVEAFVTTGAGNTAEFKPGDRVIAFTDYNAWAEVVCVSTDYIYKMPNGMSYEEGASMFSYLTAYMLLFSLGGVRPGQAVLVHSAGGSVKNAMLKFPMVSAGTNYSEVSVTSFATKKGFYHKNVFPAGESTLQAAKAGFDGLAVSQLVRTVKDVRLFGTASQHKHEHIKHGYDHLFDRTEDYVTEIKKSYPEGIHIVLDAQSGDETNRGVSLLRPLGKYILYGSANIIAGETKSFFSLAKSWWQVEKISPVKLCDENKLIGGLNVRQFLFKQNGAKEVREVMDHLFKLYHEKTIKPIIDSTYAMEDVGDAIKKMHDRKNIGKILLCPAQVPRVKEEPLANTSAPNSPPFTSKDASAPSGSQNKP